MLWINWLFIPVLNLCCAVISEEVMVNHFLPGLRCLRADMEQLSPEHEVSRISHTHSQCTHVFSISSAYSQTDGPDCLPLSIWYSQMISHNIGARQIAWLFTSFSITHSYTHLCHFYLCLRIARDPFHVSIFPRWLMISWFFSSVHIRSVCNVCIPDSETGILFQTGTFIQIHRRSLFCHVGTQLDHTPPVLNQSSS